MKIIGHRGARKEAPENTVASFVWAQQNGCRHFELDIQLSSDHELMVFHDTTLFRTTGLRGRLSELASGKLTSLDAKRSTPGWHLPATIPSLQQVIDASPHCLSWQFEVKTDSRRRLTVVAHKLAKFIKRNRLEGKASVTSGNRWFLRHFHLLYPAISIGYVAEWSLPAPVSTAAELGCHILVINHALINNTRVQRAHDAGLEVSVWTVNDLVKMKQYNDLGVDSIITDIPSTALDYFSSDTAEPR